MTKFSSKKEFFTKRYEYFKFYDFLIILLIFINFFLKKFNYFSDFFKGFLINEKPENFKCLSTSEPNINLIGS